MKSTPLLTILPDSSHDAATNMAIDASLLNSASLENAFFRHYKWTEPTVTFGYTQSIQEVRAAVSASIALCRRLTGGGIVDHRNDWTYALVLHSQIETAQIRATELYAKVHRCIQKALADQSITTQLAPCPRLCGQTSEPTTGPSQCFVTSTKDDIINANGKKIAGAAMKRTRESTLIQGSIDRSALPITLNYKEFSKGFTATLSNAFNLALSEDLKNFPDEQLIEQEEKRFRSADWINIR